MALAVNVQQRVQFHQTGGLDSQIILKGKRLSDFLFGCGLLLVKVVQLVFHGFQTLRHLSQCIVDTGEVSARVCAEACPVGHLAFQQERIFLFPSGKLHGHSKAPIAADLHRFGAFDLLTGVQQGCTGVFFVSQHIAPDLHSSKAILRVRMGGQGLQIRFKAFNKPLVSFDFLGEVFEQLILQAVLLALMVSFHQLQTRNLHIQIHALLDTGVSGAQGLDLGKGQRRFVHIIAGADRAFAGHDLRNEFLFVLHRLVE